MWKSYVASQIDSEYKRRKAFEKARRQKCIEGNDKKCNTCQYNEICLNSERKDEDRDNSN